MSSKKYLKVEMEVVEETIGQNNLSGIIALYIDKKNSKKEQIDSKTRQSIINYAKLETNKGQWPIGLALMARLDYNKRFLSHTEIQQHL